MMLLSSEKTSVLNVVTYLMVQSWALKTANARCSQAAWIKDQSINGRKVTSKLSVQSV